MRFNVPDRFFSFSLSLTLMLLPNVSLGADPWDMAFAAKEQILLGNHQAAERLLKLVQSELAHQDKEELDWELFKWTEEELKKTSQLTRPQADPIEQPIEFRQVKTSPPWYQSHWVWIGGAAAIGLWVHHENRKSKAPQSTEGFQL